MVRNRVLTFFNGHCDCRCPASALPQQPSSLCQGRRRHIFVVPCYHHGHHHKPSSSPARACILQSQPPRPGRWRHISFGWHPWVRKWEGKFSKIHALRRNRYVRKQTHPSTSSPPCKKLDKEDTSEQITKVKTDVPERARKWGSIGGGAGEGGYSLPPGIAIWDEDRECGMRWPPRGMVCFMS